MNQSPSSAPDAPAVTTVDADNPWPGPEAFREADERFFFGRNAARDDLTRLVLRNRLVILYGRSGLGKTSLLRAGVFPQLRKALALPVYIRLKHVEASAAVPDLREQVKNAIEAAAADVDVEVPVLAPDETLWEWFFRTDAHFFNARSRRVRPVLVFDQFEEAFTHGRASPALTDATEQFLDEIVDLVRGSVPQLVGARLEQDTTAALGFSTGRDPCGVLLALRQEFLAELLRLRPRLPVLLDHRFELSGMTIADGERVVTGPGGHLVEEGVGPKIAEFVAGAKRGSDDLTTDDTTVDPSILSIFCRELNNTRRDRKMPRITAELVAGTKDAIIADFYTRSVSDLGPDVQRFIESRLVTASGYRNSAAWEDAIQAPGVTAEAIELLIERRLVRREGAGPRARLELTHDVLTPPIVQSRTLREQSEQAEKARREAEEIQARERRERELKTTRELLEKNQALLATEQKNAELARELLAKQEAEARVTAELLEAQERAIEHQRQQAETAEALVQTQRKALVRQRWFAAVLVGLVAIVVFLAFVAFRERQVAESALASAHIEQGLSLASTGARSRGMAHIASAVRVQPASASARSLALDAILHVNWPLPEFVVRHKGSIYDIDIDPKGEKIVTASADRTARIWSAKDGAPIGAPLHSGDGKHVSSARFNHDGTRILTASPTLVRVWDVANTTAPLHEYDLHDDSGPRLGGNDHQPRAIGYAAFGPAGGLIAAGGAGTASGYVRLWKGRDQLSFKRLHDDDVTFLTFDDMGRRLLTASLDKTAKVWEVASGRLLATLRHNDIVVSARFSPDGVHVATASRDGRGRLWNLARPSASQPEYELPHNGAVVSIEYDATGERVVTASEDRVARVWVAGTGQPIAFDLIHDLALVSAAFAPDGVRILTASTDGTARLWNAGDGSAFAEPIRLDGPVNSARFTPDGQHVLTASDDGQAVLWDVRTGAVVPDGPDATCMGVTRFVPGTPTVVRICDDRYLLWHSLTNQSTEHELDPRLVNPVTVDISRDGTTMALVSQNRGAFLLRLAENRVVALKEKGDVTSIEFSRDGKMVLTNDMTGRSATMWDVSTGTRIGDVTADEPLAQAHFNSDGSLIITSSMRGTVQTWNTRTRQATGLTLGQAGYGSPDHSAFLGARDTRVITYIAGVAGMGAARLWDATTGKEIAMLSEFIGTSQFGPDGDVVLTIGGASPSAPKVAILSDASTGAPIATLGQKLPAVAAHFSGDGRRVAVTYDNASCRVWDARTGQPLTQALGPFVEESFFFTQFDACTLSHNGQRLLFGGQSEHMRVWVIPDSSAADAPLTARLLEAMVGYRISDSGAIERIEDQVGALRQIRAERGAQKTLSERVRAWALADRRERTINPFSTTTLDTYVRAQLALKTEKARVEAQRLLPWDLRLAPPPPPAPPPPAATPTPAKQTKRRR